MDIRIDSVFSLSVQDDSDNSPTKQKKKTKTVPSDRLKTSSLVNECYVTLERLDLENKQSLSFRKWMMHHKHCDSSCTAKGHMNSPVKFVNDTADNCARRMTRKRRSDIHKIDSCCPEKILKTETGTTKEIHQCLTTNKDTTGNRELADMNSKMEQKVKNSKLKGINEHRAPHVTSFNAAKLEKTYTSRKLPGHDDRKQNRIPKETSVTNSNKSDLITIKIEPKDVTESTEQTPPHIPLVQSLDDKTSVDMSIFDEEEEGTFQGLLQKLALAPRDKRAAYLKKLNSLIQSTNPNVSTSHCVSGLNTKTTKPITSTNKILGTKVSPEVCKSIKHEQLPTELTDTDIPSLAKQGTVIAPKVCHPTTVPQLEQANDTKTIASFRLVNVDGVPFIVRVGDSDSQHQGGKSTSAKNSMMQSDNERAIGGCIDPLLKNDIQSISTGSGNQSIKMTTVTPNKGDQQKVTSQLPAYQSTAFSENILGSTIVPTDIIGSTSKFLCDKAGVNRVEPVKKNNKFISSGANVDVKAVDEANEMRPVNCDLNRQGKDVKITGNKNTLAEKPSPMPYTPGANTLGGMSKYNVTSSNLTTNVNANQHTQVLAPMLIHGNLQNVLFNVQDNGSLSVVTANVPEEKGGLNITQNDIVKSSNSVVVGNMPVNNDKSLETNMPNALKSVDVDISGKQHSVGIPKRPDAVGHFPLNKNPSIVDTPILAMPKPPIVPQSSAAISVGSSQSKQVVVSMLINGTVQNVLFNVLKGGNLSVATVSESKTNPASVDSKLQMVNKIEVPLSHISNLESASCQQRSPSNVGNSVQPEIAPVSTLVKDAISCRTTVFQGLNANQNNTQVRSPLPNFENAATKPIFLVPSSANIRQPNQENAQGPKLLNHLLSQTGQLASNGQPIFLANSQLQTNSNQSVGNSIFVNQTSTGLLVPQMPQSNIQSNTGILNLKNVEENSLNMNSQIPANILIVQPNTSGLPVQSQQISSNVVVPVIPGNQSNTTEQISKTNFRLPLPPNQVLIPIKLDNSNEKANMGHVTGCSVARQPQQLQTSLFISNKDGKITDTPNLIAPAMLPCTSEIMTLLGRNAQTNHFVPVVSQARPKSLLSSSSVSFMPSILQPPPLVASSKINRPDSSCLKQSLPVCLGNSTSSTMTAVPQAAVEVVSSASQSSTMKYSPSKLLKKAVKSKSYERQMTQQIKPTLIMSHSGNIGCKNKTLTSSSSLTSIQVLLQSPVVQQHGVQLQNTSLLPSTIPLTCPIENIMQVNKTCKTVKSDMISTFKKTPETTLIPAQGYSKSSSNVQEQNMFGNKHSLLTNQDFSSSESTTIKTSDKITETFEKRNKRKPQVVVRVDPDILDITDDVVNPKRNSSSKPTTFILPREELLSTQASTKTFTMSSKVQSSIEEPNIVDNLESAEKECLSKTPILIIPKKLPTPRVESSNVGSDLRPTQPFVVPNQTLIKENTIVEKGLRVPPHIVQQLQKQRLPDLQRKQAVVESTVQKLLQNKMSNT